MVVTTRVLFSRLSTNSECDSVGWLRNLNPCWSCQEPTFAGVNKNLCRGEMKSHLNVLFITHSCRTAIGRHFYFWIEFLKHMECL